MQKIILFSLAVVLLVATPGMSADKVVVIPMGAGASGAAGQIQYNDGGQTAGADIYYDKLSGKVGIGKTDPSEALDVNGNIKANVFLGDGSSLTGVVTTESDPVWTAASTSVQDNIDAVDTKADSNINSITTINSRQRLTDTDTASLVITTYDQDISTGMSLNVQGRGRDILIIASINVNNTVDSSSHDTSLRFDVRFNSVVRRTETVVLKGDSRHMLTLQWLERAVTLATHSVDVIVNATNRVNLENRYFYVVEL